MSLTAEGAAAESHLASGNRTPFAAPPLTTLQAGIRPGSEPRDPCTPMVFDGSRPARVLVADRAA